MTPIRRLGHLMGKKSAREQFEQNLRLPLFAVSALDTALHC
jgi:hypothetical protein